MPRKAFHFFNISLKTRIFLSFFGLLFCMACAYLFTVSKFITHYTEDRLDADYEYIVSEACDAVENALWNLTLASQQILEHEDVQKSISSYQNTPNLYAKKNNYSFLLDTISTLTMPNTNIGLIYLFDITEQDFIYSSLPASAAESPAPVLYENTSFQFCGPCHSQSSFIGNPVLILNRTEEIPGGHPVTLSLESSAYCLEKPLADAAQKSAYFIFTNEEGRLLYTNLPDAETDMQALPGRIPAFSLKGYRSFSQESPQGWSVHIAVPDSVYTQDYQYALRDFAFYTLLLVALAAFFALYFWSCVYHPLQTFDRQLTCLLSDEPPDGLMHSSIPEYDRLMQKVLSLQMQNRLMLADAVHQEQLQSRMRLEKLRAQINPHFLMNTLNTVHWIALMNGQNDIDRITQSLAHLLSYNLDKQDYTASIGSELAALKEYLSLQKVRYSFTFETSLPENPAVLTYPCPKFILQPLAENSLSHGYREHMLLLFSVSISADRVQLSLKDTGAGIPSDTLAQIRRICPHKPAAPGSRRRHGISRTETVSAASGIGLQYVIQSLYDFYKEEGTFSIESLENTGTEVLLTFPAAKGETIC